MDFKVDGRNSNHKIPGEIHKGDGQNSNCEIYLRSLSKSEKIVP